MKDTKINMIKSGGVAEVNRVICHFFTFICYFLFTDFFQNLENAKKVKPYPPVSKPSKIFGRRGNFLLMALFLLRSPKYPYYVHHSPISPSTPLFLF